MKIRTDEHVSPIIASTIDDLTLRAGWEISSVLSAGDQGASDVHWITRFAQHGGDAILSADQDFVRLAPQINAVFDTGMKVILLPPKWANATAHLQAAHILQW